MSRPEPESLLVGAVDLHIHPSPSPFPRRIGIDEAAAQAHETGFRAIVVKSHHHSMVPDIAAVRAAAGGLPLDVYGGVALNDHVGGLNPYAVELALRQGGKIVWLPTIAAAKHVALHSDALNFPTATMTLRAPSGISMLADDGELKPELLDILELIRDAGAILAGGHVDVAELDLVFKAGHEMGLERMLVNHPNFIVDAAPDRCRAWSVLGVRSEHSLAMYDTDSPFCNWTDLGPLLEYIEVVGVAHTVLCSDLGQTDNPLPVETYLKIVGGLLDAGVASADIKRMVGDNAAELLGL